MDENRPQYRRNYYTSDDSGKVNIIAVLAPQITVLLFYLLGRAIATSAGLDAAKINSYLWFSIPLAFIAPLTFCLVFFLYNKFAKISNGAVNIKPAGWKNTLLSVAIGVIGLLGIQLFIMLINHLLGLVGYPLSSEGAEGIENAFGIPLSNVGWLFLNIFAVGLLPAVFEELIFRGIILSGLRKNTSDFLAIFLSALMFALMHGNLEQFVYPLLLGMILGWLVVRTGSVLSSMIAHFVNNAVNLIMAYCFNFKVPINWWIILLAFVLLGLTGLAVFLIDRFHFHHKSAVEEEHKGRLSLFVWVSLAVGAVLLILTIILAFNQPLPNTNT